MKNKYEILKNTFGHENFRSFQEDVVDAILNKNDVLTILPTGGGKSLCYQLPTLLMDGLTVVISPLIALMQDQVRALKDLNIQACMINSSLSINENNQVLQDILASKVKFVYVAPERFLSNDFVAVLQRVNINYFVIDEAHCVSAWGHEFRAEYRNLHILKKFFPDTSIAAFTATATNIVQEDISSSLLLNSPKEFRAKTQRDNLIISCDSRISNGKTQVLNFLKTHRGLCGIIYTFTRKETLSTSKYLNEAGYKASAYHAGLSTDIKNEVFNDFVYEKIDIVVATIAFGMGIDKSNIRFVIHTSMPKTLENYYQEIGRAGRDGALSYVHLLYSKSDEIKRKIQIDDALDLSYKNTALEKLEKMYRYCISNKCRHQLIASYFDDEIKECETSCDSCTKEPATQVDVKLDAQKLLSAIYRSEEKFGLNHIIDILRGSKNQKLLDMNHDKLSVYAIGKDKNKNEWIAIADKLIDIQAIVLGEFRVLKLNSIAFDILKNKTDVFIDSDKLGQDIKAYEEEKELSFDDKLFEKFKSLRRELSSEAQVPAYVIFGDKTLKELSLKLPCSKDEMLDINGIGEVKYEKYGEAFLVLCESIKNEFQEKLSTKVELKKLSKTYLDTLELLQENKKLSECAMIRDLALSSILGHVKLLYEHEKISKEFKDSLLKEIELSAEIKAWIQEGIKLKKLKDLKQDLYLYEALKDLND